MKRVATVDIELSDGASILSGDLVAISHHNLRDPNVYPNPDKFDGYRFLRMRETPGLENSSQLVSTSANYLAWGHGKHACPGRFFASNEVKIALCHILLKYDFRYPDENRPVVVKAGFSTNSDPSMRIVIRRRQEDNTL
jgi:cytochrome P450